RRAASRRSRPTSDSTLTRLDERSASIRAVESTASSAAVTVLRHPPQLIWGTRNCMRVSWYFWNSHGKDSHYGNVNHRSETCAWLQGRRRSRSERSADAAPAGRLTARRSQNGATRLGRFIGGMRRPNFLVYGLQVTRWKFATEGTSKCQVSTEE